MPKRRFPALNRLKWITISYITRPMVLWMTAIGILTSVPMLFEKINSDTPMRPIYPAAPESRLAVTSPDSLKYVRAEGLQKDVDELDLNFFWQQKWMQEREQNPAAKYTPPDPDFYQIIDEFPNLRILQERVYNNQGYDLAPVARLKHLEYLSLDGSGVKDLAPLRNARELRRLDWIAFEPLPNLSALASLPALETIVIRNRMAVNDTVLRDLSSLPHLQVLVLAFDDFASPPYPLNFKKDYPLTREGFEALARAPALTTIYAGGKSPSQTTNFGTLAHEVNPRWKILPAMESMNIINTSIWIGCFCLSITIGGQLSSQLRHPLRKLAPGFTWNHVLVAVVLSTIVLGLTTVAVRKSITDRALWPALIFSGSLFAAGFASTALSGLGPIQPSGQQRLIYFGSVLFFLLLVLPNTSFGMRLLRGDEPVGLAILAICGLVAMGLTVWLLWQLLEWSSNSSSLDRNVSLQELAMTRFRSGWMMSTARREREIDELPRSPDGWSWWSRVQRWRAGNPPFRVALFVLTFLAWIGGLQLLMFGGNLGPGRRNFHFNSSIIRSIFPMVLIGILALVGFRVAMIWRARIRVLPLEILRPVSRRTLQREWAAAFLLDILPTSSLLAAVAALLFNLNEVWQVNWKNVPLSFALYLTFALTLVIGGGAIFIVVQRIWLAMVLVFGVVMVSQFVMSGILIRVMTQSGIRFSSSTNYMLLGLLVPIVLNSLMALLAWRIWKRMEIGQRA